jgi:hypothetical protein
MHLRAFPRCSLLIAIAAALLLSADDSAAQLEFAQIPWGTPEARTIEHITSAGYTFRGTDQDGDMVFGAADSVDLVAMFDSAGLVAVESQWMRNPDRLLARYRRMADSMRAAVGTPDETLEDESGRSLNWGRDGATLELFFRPRGGGLDTMLIVRHQGAGYEAEFERRVAREQEQTERERADGTRDTTAVGDYHQAFGGFRVLIRVDTVTYERLGPQAYRARFLYDWMQTRRLPNGLMYNAALTEVELDCRVQRTRLLRTIPLYAFRATPPIDVPEAERRWTTPRRGAPDVEAVRSACQALARQP